VLIFPVFAAIVADYGGNATRRNRTGSTGESPPKRTLEMTAIETAHHLENLLISHRITQALKASVTIVLHRDSTGWNATFNGGDMPQGEVIPLPYTARAPYGIVANETADRFPGAVVIVRLD
jgi:hypothetical protein